MSNALAIATVTQTLVNRVTASLPSSLVGGGVTVSTSRPDDESLQGPETAPRVNIFLYQVTPNASLRNADLPTRRPDGSLVKRPQLALDLHYLFTFYGTDSNLEQQRLLGAVASQLHASPTLHRSEILAAENTPEPTSGVLYLASQLSQQSEIVRITPIDFSLDDISKLWAAFPTVDFVLSVVYMASVVLIETDDVPPGPALPVLKRRVQAIPFSLSLIDSIDPQSVALSASPPTTIELIGQGLNTDNTAAFMTPGSTDPIFAAVGPGATPTLVPVTLPAGLRPGVNSVQLMQTLASPPGSPPSSSVLSTSNSMTFVVLPTLVSLSPASPPGSLQAVVFPTVGPKQQVSLVLNQQGGPAAFTLPADPHTAETDTFTFSTVFTNPQAAGGTSAVPSGTYLARVQVDSAESRLTLDATGEFNGPTVTL